MQAVTRRIDSSAGNLMRIILNLMNESGPWAPVSTQINQMDIFQKVRNAELTSAVGADGRLQVLNVELIRKNKFCFRNTNRCNAEEEKRLYKFKCKYSYFWYGFDSCFVLDFVKFLDLNFVKFSICIELSSTIKFFNS